MNNNLPILYSFRRCPYAMRARLAIYQANISVELREVVLRNKPQHLLQVSPKATVPVLLLPDGQIIEESLDIMDWALSENDPQHWLDNHLIEDIKRLIAWNDGEFKYYLDRYKYADRYPEFDAIYYRQKAEEFLKHLEQRLKVNDYLCSTQPNQADIAIFPFIRQFANVDLEWFQSSPYQKLSLWLTKHIESDLFISIMDKYPAWKENDDPLLINR